jgi:hypothetical protein
MTCIAPEPHIVLFKREINYIEKVAYQLCQKQGNFY